MFQDLLKIALKDYQPKIYARWIKLHKLENWLNDQSEMMEEEISEALDAALSQQQRERDTMKKLRALNAARAEATEIALANKIEEIKALEAVS
ncbi:hypothetical protein [Solemya velum gill symbiont]|uniref:hypothetical protein n=1 Tax=Solemya velum gill symbiont TaxID=2340 RepID=UPI0009974C95|nr:hypothetical protein [Solemya velum gill symbiont]